MSSRCPESLGASVAPAAGGALWPVALCLGTLCALGALSGCERERRDFSPPQGKAVAPATRQSPIQPAQPMPPNPPASTHADGTGLPDTPYTIEGNAYAVSQGKRLYRWYNCSACHAPGGGGDWGPALSDDKWRYGSRPEDIFRSISEGRPEGMPSFGGHVPQDQIWQLVAYVRSLSGQLRKDVAPNRADALQQAPAESTRARETPREGR